MLWAISSLPGIDVKVRSNLAKHGVSFEEAQAVFLDYQDSAIVDSLTFKPTDLASEADEADACPFS